MIRYTAELIGAGLTIGALVASNMLARGAAAAPARAPAEAAALPDAA